MSFYRPSVFDVARFREDGYVIVRNLLTPEEVDLLSRVARADKHLAETAYGREDAKGAVVTLAVRNDLSDDIYSAIARSRRIVSAMAAFLNGEVYHYHHKLILKEPRVGGAWEWHQDYGYWYNNGCLLPDMGSCLMGIDRATKENGCLQVLKGSHHIGRIEHLKTGDQTGADMERVNAALARFELVYVEMEPGDAVLFHANLLHRSDQNHSEHPRWALIGAYNTRRNDPYKAGRHTGYTPTEIGPDEMVLTTGQRQWDQLQQSMKG
jgi:ectoine hydroxylase